jgi:SAM-dependent methyltransferase
MSDDISDIVAYYDNSPETEHNRLERHQLEFDLTWRYLERYLPPQGRVLEIGAATGRYTVGLAQRGYQVTAVDLSTGELALCRETIASASPGALVEYVVADARDLSVITRADYDAALLMGPLYHLIEESDRLTAVRQVYDRLRDGGVLFSAFISRYGIFGDLMRKIPDWVEDRAEVDGILSIGSNPHHVPGSGFRAYFATVGEIAPLHEAAGFETLAVAAVEPCISSDDESYNILEGERRRLWLELFDAISQEPSSVGASRHLLYVGRKPGR